MAQTVASEKEMPWVVVSDTNKDEKTIDGFCRGHMTEAEAKVDAEERTARAKTEFGKDWTYRAIPNPLLGK